MSRRSNRLSEQDKKGVKNIIEGKAVYVPSFDEALDEFLKEAKLRNLRPDTIVYYRNELNTFRKIFQEQDIPLHLNQITSDMLKDHLILYMLDNGAKVGAVNTRLRAIKAFFNWLEGKEWVKPNPTKDVSLLKDKRNVIETFTKKDLRAMFSACDLTTFTGVRDYTIMLFLLETGIRLKELIQINVQDVDLDAGQVLVTDPKNQLERYVPIGATTCKQLRTYLRLRGYLETDALFVSVNNERLSRAQIQNQIRKIGKKAGVTGVRCSPHTFRHTFAKMSILNGAGPFELQAILGHQSMDMVRVYVNLFSPEVKEMHKRFSPVEKL